MSPSSRSSWSTTSTHAVPIARALVAGGLPVIELTLRTPAALDAIERIAGEVPEILVGAGTILVRGPGQAEPPRRARSSSSRPGSTPALLDAMADTGLPYLPGASTVSEMLTVARGAATPR